MMTVGDGGFGINNTGMTVTHEVRRNHLGGVDKVNLLLVSRILEGNLGYFALLVASNQIYLL